MPDALLKSVSNLLLIVDDDRAHGEMIALYLRRWRIAVAQRHDGWQAIDAIMTLDPALVLMDIDLPGCTGVEVVRRVCAMGRDPQVILMSGYDACIREAHESRLSFFRMLHKPLPLRLLAPFLRECLSQPARRAAS